MKDKLQQPFTMEIIVFQLGGFGLFKTTRSSIISIPLFNLGKPFTPKKSD
jgi:hypothetical protein